MTNILEIAKTIILEATRYLFNQNQINFIDAFEENEFIQEFVRKIDYSKSLLEIKKILNESQAKDLKKILKSEEFYQFLKNTKFNEEDMLILKELIK